MVFGAKTFREFVQMIGASVEGSDVRDPWVGRMRSLPATVLSKTLTEPLEWPDATVVSGDAVEIVSRLKEESSVPLRSHGSLSVNKALMAAGLVDINVACTAGMPPSWAGDTNTTHLRWS